VLVVVAKREGEPALAKPPVAAALVVLNGRALETTLAPEVPAVPNGLEAAVRSV
jgi:hypothetical protein